MKIKKKNGYNSMKRILYLCTGNSCRSQMAEAWTRHLQADEWQAFSAGSAPSAMDPLAMEAMKMAGVDISRQRPKPMGEFLEQNFDYIVTLCDNARAACPMFQGGGKKVHRGFDDPPALARFAKTHAEAMAHYLRVTDEIKEMVLGLPQSLEE